MYKILIVDDEQEVLDACGKYFERAGYSVCCAADGKEALRLTKGQAFECIILDIALPDMDGFIVYSLIREETCAPVLFLSNYTEEESRIRGLKMGADDYVCKPFSLEELELRVRARIRPRYEERPLPTLEYSGLKIDPGERRVWYKETEGEFSRIEFDILLFLARHPGQVFSYGQIHDGVWGTPINMGRHTLQARVAEVRQKLNDLCPDREYITTVRGRGYRFNAF